MHQEEEQKTNIFEKYFITQLFAFDVQLLCTCATLHITLHTKRWKITNRKHSLNVTLIWNWWDFYAIAGESINVRFPSTWIWCIISIRFDAYLLLQKQQIHYKHSTHYKRMPLYNYNYCNKTAQNEMQLFMEKIF